MCALGNVEQNHLCRYCETVVPGAGVCVFMGSQGSGKHLEICC